MQLCLVQVRAQPRLIVPFGDDVDLSEREGSQSAEQQEQKEKTHVQRLGGAHISLCVASCVLQTRKSHYEVPGIVHRATSVRNDCVGLCDHRVKTCIKQSGELPSGEDPKRKEELLDFRQKSQSPWTHD